MRGHIPLVTYYQELGVDPGASAEEIRRAYRHQIKVFHPDRQHDERMRAAAEAKVRRLNEIVEVLADPELRRAYDHQHVLCFRDITPGASTKRPVWITLAGAVSLVGLLWAWMPGEPSVSAEDRGGVQTPVKEPRRRIAPPTARPAVSEPNAAEQKRTGSPPERATAPEPGPVSAVPLAATPASKAAEPPRTGPLPAPPAPTVPAPDVATVSEDAEGRVEESSLEGTWLFQPARAESGEKKLYPPKYIELRIQSEAGKLFGRYRSSYEVHDQALSPNVNFNFQGPAAVSHAKAAWTGPGGARGSVELELLNPMTLRVDWKTEETGPGLDLVEGTAVLVKRLEN